MFRDVLSHADITEWPIAALILFLVCSAAILFWIFRKGSSAHYNKLSNLVFDNDASSIDADQKESNV